MDIELDKENATRPHAPAPASLALASPSPRPASMLAFVGKKIDSLSEGGRLRAEARRLYDANDQPAFLQFIRDAHPAKIPVLSSEWATWALALLTDAILNHRPDWIPLLWRLCPLLRFPLNSERSSLMKLAAKTSTPSVIRALVQLDPSLLFTKHLSAFLVLRSPMEVAILALRCDNLACLVALAAREHDRSDPANIHAIESICSDAMRLVECRGRSLAQQELLEPMRSAFSSFPALFALFPLFSQPAPPTPIGTLSALDVPANPEPQHGPQLDQQLDHHPASPSASAPLGPAAHPLDETGELRSRIEQLTQLSDRQERMMAKQSELIAQQEAFIRQTLGSPTPSARPLPTAPLSALGSLGPMQPSKALASRHSKAAGHGA